MLRVLSWVGVALFALLSLLFIGVTVAIVADVTGRPVQAADFANRRIPTGRPGSALYAYVAEPEAGVSGPPVVLLLHEWWGLNDNIVRLADRLAGAGYLVVAADLWRGRSTRRVPTALWQLLTVDEERLDGDVDAYIRYIEELDGGDRRRLAVVGFCYGGGEALRHALRRPVFDAAAVFYGTPVIDIDRLAAIRPVTSVLGIFGGSDLVIKPAAVARFDAALAGAGVDHRIELLGDVGHAFVTDAALEAGHPQATAAWDLLLDFLDRTIG